MKWPRVLCLLAVACGGPVAQSATSTSSAPTPSSVSSGSAAGDNEFFLVPSDEGLEVGGALQAPLPVAVTSFGAIQAGGATYVFGGYAGRPHEYNREGQSPSLWRLASDEWVEVARLSHGLQGSPLVEVDGAPCRLGGTRIDNAPGEDLSMHSIADVSCFVDGAWQDAPDLPAPRSSFDAARVGSKVCVAGGWSLSGSTNGEWSDDVLCREWDGDAREWRSYAAPFHRRALATAGVGNELLVIGGLDDQRNVVTTVNILNLESGEWSAGPDFPEAAFGVSATTIGDSVYASAVSGVVYRWSPGDSEWTPAATLAYPRFFHQLVASGDGLMALGGIGGMHTAGRVRHVERVDLAPATMRISEWSVAFPGASKNRQATFVDGEFLYLFGGNNSLGQHDFEAENFVDEGWRVHLPSMRIESQPALPVRRQSMVVSRAGGAPIAIGGFGHDGEAAVSQQGILRYGAGGWRQVGEIPESRTQFGIFSRDGHVSLVGGLSYDPAREGEAAFDHVTSILRADAGTLAFETHSLELPATRRAFASATHNGDFYIVGGMRAGFQLVDDCVVLRGATGEFEELPCPEQTRLSGDLVVIDEHLVLLGGSVRGEEGMAPAQDVQVYDPANPEAGWNSVGTIPFSMKHARAMRFEGRLLVYSTHYEEARIRVALINFSLSP
ncbi:MAG: hypothetical protein AB8H86_10265 [Polyangiales bacterium]